MNTHLITHQITLLKCSSLGDKGVSGNIRVVEIDLTALKTHEMNIVAQILKSNWTWIALICVPVVRFIIPVPIKGDGVKGIEGGKKEILRSEKVKNEIKRTDYSMIENSWEEEEFYCKNENNLKNEIIISSELLNTTIPIYLLFYKKRNIEREQSFNVIKNGQYIRKNFDQEKEYFHQHYYDQESIGFDYFNLLFLIGILLYGMIIMKSSIVLYHSMLYVYTFVVSLIKLIEL